MELLQEFYLKKALEESNTKYDSYKIDHNNGLNYIDGKEMGIIFPKSLLDLCESKWKKERTSDFYFKGLVTDKRKWLNGYENVHHSTRGRDESLKYTYDDDYYENLGNTKYALCPPGDCLWSYRFFEAIMCGAIPVLGDEDNDVYSGDYKVYRDRYVRSNSIPYDEEEAKHNLSILRKKCIL